MESGSLSHAQRCQVLLFLNIRKTRSAYEQMPDDINRQAKQLRKERKELVRRHRKALGGKTSPIRLSDADLKYKKEVTLLENQIRAVEEQIARWQRQGAKLAKRREEGILRLQAELNNLKLSRHNRLSLEN